MQVTIKPESKPILFPYDQWHNPFWGGDRIEIRKPQDQVVKDETQQKRREG